MTSCACAPVQFTGKWPNVTNIPSGGMGTYLLRVVTVTAISELSELHFIVSTTRPLPML